MKKTLLRKAAFFVLPFLVGGSLVACGGNAPTSGTIPTDPSVGPQPVPKTDSEKAMDNFLNKIKDGNYTITSDNLVSSFYSRDLVMYDYDASIHEAKDQGFMSVDNETFQLSLANEHPLDYILFVDQGQAIDVVGTQSLNYLINNPWDYWTNSDPSKPFDYSSTSVQVKQSISQFVVLGEMAAMTISDMELVFDSVDVNSATLKATYCPSSPTEKIPLNLAITFGDAKYNQDMANWTKDPNRNYPSDIGKTSWTNNMVSLFEGVLKTNDLKDYVPLMTSASYACVINSQLYSEEGIVEVRDYHGTAEDAKNYKNLLEDNNFYKVTVDGVETYRKFLRAKPDNPIFQVFADLSVNSDDNGVTLRVNSTYNRQYLHSIDALNKLITPKSFPALPETDNIADFVMFNSPFEGQESWDYLYNFDLESLFVIQYKDLNVMKKYVSDYIGALTEVGFKNTPSSPNIYHLIDQTSDRKFQYVFYDDGTVHLVFANEAFLNPTKVTGEINEVFPVISSDNIYYCRDNAMLQKIKRGQNWTHYYDLVYLFDSEADATTFYNSYLSSVASNPDYKKNTEQSDLTYDNTTNGNRIVFFSQIGNRVDLMFGIK